MFTPSSDFFKRLLDNLSTAILLVDDKLHVSYLNPSAEMLLAISRTKAVGHPLESIFIDSLGGDIIPKMAKTLKTAHPFTKREAHLRVGINEVVVDYTVAALLSPNEPPALLIEMQQIDRLLRISREESILANHQVTKQLVRGVAHEIKNPLTPMRLSIQHLQRAIQSNAPNVKELTSKVTDTILEQIDNLTHIASEFSNFAVMPKAVNEQLCLNDLLTNVTSLFNEHDHVELTLQLPDNRIEVFADKNQLLRVFNNVIKNAIQAIPDDREGKINVILYMAEHRAMVKVTDNGRGISENEKDKVFVPNFTTKSSGMGIGLAMCKNIVESAGGYIWFESVEGQGTTFYIELPVIAD